MSRRVGMLVFLGFAAGVPNRLLGDTLVAWATEAGVDLATVALFALVTLPFSTKLLWAWILDRYTVPVLGRRRGWMAALQAAVGIGLLGLAAQDPAAGTTGLVLVALGVALASGSLDVVVDAYRTDVLPPRERGPGAATYVAGYRGALVVVGAGALVLADHLAWSAVYALFACLMLATVLATVLAPEPEDPGKPPRTLRAAVLDPILELLGRPGAWATLAFVLLFKSGEFLVSHMDVAFLLTVGFTKTEIGIWLQGVGMGASITGALVGGALLPRVGLKRGLFVFGALQASTNLAYLWLESQGPSVPSLIAVLTVDNLFGGLGTVTFVAFLMALCKKSYSATQYALFSSLFTLAGRLLTAPSGTVAQHHGWPVFFLLTLVLAIPALVLLRWVPDPEMMGHGDRSASQARAERDR